MVTLLADALSWPIVTSPPSRRGTDPADVAVGRRLREARQRRGLTQARLAAAVTERAAAAGDRLTLTPSAVSRWERGVFRPALRYRPHLEAVLGVSLAGPAIGVAGSPGVWSTAAAPGGGPAPGGAVAPQPRGSHDDRPGVRRA